MVAVGFSKLWLVYRLGRQVPAAIIPHVDGPG